MPIASSTDAGAVVPGIPDPRQRARGASVRAGTALLLAVGVVFLLLATVSPAVAVTIRWASSSGIIHVTGPGTATLSELAAPQLPAGALLPRRRRRHPARVAHGHHRQRRRLPGLPGLRSLRPLLEGPRRHAPGPRPDQRLRRHQELPHPPQLLRRLHVRGLR